MPAKTSRSINDRIDAFGASYSKKMGVDLPYFMKGGFWLLLAQTSSFLKSFLLSLAFANLLTKETFGHYTFIISLLGFMMLFALPGMAQAVIQAVARGKEGTYTKGLSLTFRWSWLGSLALLACAIYSFLTGWSDATLLLILAAIQPFYAVSGYFSWYFTGRKLFKKRFLLLLIADASSTLIVIATLLLTKDIFWIVLAVVLSQTLIQGYFSVFTVKKSLKNSDVDQRDLAFGKKTSLSTGFMNVIFMVDALIVGKLLGFEQLAIYAIITLIPDQGKNSFKMLSHLLIPKLASKSISRKDIMRMFWKLLGGSILLMAAYALLAPPLFHLFYPQYQDYVWLSVLFALGFIALPNIPLFSALYIRRKTTAVNRINIITSTYLVVGAIVWISFLGLLGAVINRLVYRALSLALSLHAHLKEE